MQTPGVAQGLKIISRQGSERIIRLAFELARAEGRKTVHCATKANILKLTEGLFKRVFEEVAAEYTDIRAEHLIVDNCAHQMVMRPEQFDVIVMTNMNGDILSDWHPPSSAAGLCAVGEPGRPRRHLRSGPRLGPADRRQGRRQPILSAVLMLRLLGEMRHAEVVENALLATLEDGKALTTDIAGLAGVGTKAFTREIIENLGRAPKAFSRPGRRKLKMPKLRAVRGLKLDIRRVIGVDVFVETRLPPEELGRSVKAAVEGLPLSLSHISSRGAKIYPNELGIEVDASDCLRLRFKGPSSGSVKDNTIIELLARLSGVAPWVHIEKLSEFRQAGSKDQARANRAT